MTISSTPRRNRAVVALWRAYHSHARIAKESRDHITGWDAFKRDLEGQIEVNDRAAMECLDILSQIGEDVSRVPRLEDIDAMEAEDGV